MKAGQQAASPSLPVTCLLSGAQTQHAAWGGSRLIAVLENTSEVIQLPPASFYLSLLQLLGASR